MYYSQFVRRYHLRLFGLGMTRTGQNPGDRVYFYSIQQNNIPLQGLNMFTYTACLVDKKHKETQETVLLEILVQISKDFRSHRHIDESRDI